jgi:hypothetical protein
VVKNRRTNEQTAPRLLVGPAGLLFFIDKTGHETFADKNYPVFGLGGCDHKLRGRTKPFDIFAGALINRYRDLPLRIAPAPNEVAFLHEASDRCDQLVENDWAELSSRSTTISSPYMKGWLQKQTACPN